MRVAWATDLHLNFVSRDRAGRFCVEVLQSGAEVLLVGGDTAEAGDLEEWLRYLVDTLQIPVWFVLGNHDYYRGSIEEVRATARRLTREVEELTWLSEAAPICLTEQTALVGHGGWGDHRAGNFSSTPIQLNDHILIKEISWLPRPELREELRRLGDQAARHLREVAAEALVSRPRVVVLTHVPPFVEACWHEGALSNADWQPDFTCVATGEVLAELADQHPNRKITVLCGHTHGAGQATLRENLRVITGGAEYGEPAIARLLDL